MSNKIVADILVQKREFVGIPCRNGAIAAEVSFDNLGFIVSAELPSIGS